MAASSSSATRYPGLGFNLEGKCENAGCASLNQQKLIPLGFGSFNVNTLSHDTSCQECRRALAIDAYIIRSAHFSIEGMDSNKKRINASLMVPDQPELRHNFDGWFFLDVKVSNLNSSSNSAAISLEPPNIQGMCLISSHLDHRFCEKATTHPYLLRKGDALELISKEEASEVLDQYGIFEEKAKKLSLNALDLLQKHKVQTGQDLIQLYNTSDEQTRKTLFPLFNIMLVIFQRKRPIQREEEIKTLTLFATCEDDAIRTAALDAMMQLFGADGFQNVDYGYGLKYLIDQLPPEFLNTNQLRLLTIFEKLTKHLDNLLHTGRTVNHEIEPLMATLISIARATRQSEIPGLAKGTKDNFYARLKQFYYNEEYTKRITSLSKDKNYLLEFEAIWPLQHLVRVPSSEHKAVTFIRKTGHGLYAARKLAGTAPKAFMGLLNGGVLPDEQIIPDLQEAYSHAEQAFGFKDIPRPWFDMLEHTEEALMKPELTPKTLEIVYKVATEYDQMRYAFNKVVAHNLKKITGKDKNEVSLKENKEFAFGFVGQLSDLAMDHPDETVRHKAIEILERVFLENKQSKDVRVFILTTLQNITQRKGNPEDAQKAQTLKDQLETSQPDLQGVQLFRASKYSCLALKPDSSLLLDAAKQKFQRSSSLK